MLMERKENAGYEELYGKVFFRHVPTGGVMITAEVVGLPDRNEFLGMHIHEVGDCTLPFDKTGSHYNPDNAAHPMHAGDSGQKIGCGTIHAKA